MKCKWRMFDGERLTRADLAWREAELPRGLNQPGTIEYLQAHLIRHFQLDYDPIPIGRSTEPTWIEKVDLKWGRIKGKKAHGLRARLSAEKRNGWEHRLSIETMHYLDEQTEKDKPSLVPQIHGRPVSSDQLGRLWRRMLP